MYLPNKKSGSDNPLLVDGAPGRTRICSLLLRKQTLYPIELRGHILRSPHTIPQRRRTVKRRVVHLHHWHLPCVICSACTGLAMSLVEGRNHCRFILDGLCPNVLCLGGTAIWVHHAFALCRSMRFALAKRYEKPALITPTCRAHFSAPLSAYWRVKTRPTIATRGCHCECNGVPAQSISGVKDLLSTG